MLKPTRGSSVRSPDISDVPDRVSAFIGAAAGLPVESFVAIRNAVAEATAAGARDAALVPALGAADFGALNKRVRDALEPRAAELRAAAPGTLRAAIANTTVAAQAIWKRETLTPEEFDSYVGVFRDAGVTQGIVPDAATDRNSLVEVARRLHANLAEAPNLNIIDLPDDLGICAVHAVRGGGKIYVAPDESALFVASTADFEAGLAAFRAGERTPLTKFEPRARGTQ
ncbi:hypothetical protein [Microbacterium cremeum]|uniref:hypothetical protein n=1 Tax=Microbacterium cremeum TaxID=2782169 RepID=UPI00188882CB|nr:hypothetical protein [Microbacterium cremeum]